MYLWDMKSWETFNSEVMKISVTAFRWIILAAAGAALYACGFASGENGGSWWDSPEAWYESGRDVNPEYTDVLYFVSTNVMESFDADGNESVRAILNPEEKELLSHEIGHMCGKVYRDSLNFFAPFYHEMTMDGFKLPYEQMEDALEATFEECLEAFRYYMDNLNGGRPFILAGYSQGAMMVKHILKNMTEEQFKGMVAAYVIGFELTAEDLRSPHIRPAQNAYDKGVTISFNSVCDVDCTWDWVCSEPAACINPVNWCTDSTPAQLVSGETSLSVAMDPSHNVVVVTGYGDNPPKSPYPEPWPSGNLHGQELRLYSRSLSRNALDRAY